MLTYLYSAISYSAYIHMCDYTFCYNKDWFSSHDCVISHYTYIQLQSRYVNTISLGSFTFIIARYSTWQQFLLGLERGSHISPDDKYSTYFGAKKIWNPTRNLKIYQEESRLYYMLNLFYKDHTAQPSTEHGLVALRVSIYHTFWVLFCPCWLLPQSLKSKVKMLFSMFLGS